MQKIIEFSNSISSESPIIYYLNNQTLLGPNAVIHEMNSAITNLPKTMSIVTAIIYISKIITEPENIN